MFGYHRALRQDYQAGPRAVASSNGPARTAVPGFLCLESEWGIIEGEINFQSVMNTSFRLRGTDLFLDMYENPDRVIHLNDIIYDTLVPLIDEIYNRQSRSGAERSFFVTANCVVNMRSNDHYRKF